MKIIFFLLLSIGTYLIIIPSITPYKFLHDSLISSSGRVCPCSDFFTNNNIKYSFWFNKAVADNDERLLYLLLHHPYQRTNSDCPGFNPFTSSIDREMLTLSPFEIALLNPEPNELTKKMLTLWTTESEENPFLEEWKSLYDRWRFQIRLLKYLELIPFGNNEESPFLKPRQEQQDQWMFWIRCYWTFLNSTDDYLYNRIEYSFNYNKQSWSMFAEEHINTLINLSANQLNMLSSRVKGKIRNAYSIIFERNPETHQDKVILRGQSESLFLSEQLINAYRKLHL